MVNMSRHIVSFGMFGSIFAQGIPYETLHINKTIDIWSPAVILLVIKGKLAINIVYVLF